MMLYKLETALRLANSLWGTGIRVSVGDTVAEIKGADPALHACAMYGHLPIKRAYVDSGIICLHVQDRTEWLNAETAERAPVGRCLCETAVQRLFGEIHAGKGAAL